MTTPDLERAIKAGQRKGQVDGITLQQAEKSVLAAVAALDPPSDAVLKTMVAAYWKHPLIDDALRAAISAYLAAIRGEK